MENICVDTENISSTAEQSVTVLFFHLFTLSTMLSILILTSPLYHVRGGVVTGQDTPQLE